MRDDLNITCSEVNKRLKSFLEDLLTEEEYQAFLAHIESCTRCKEYVNRIGSLSNQLWKLGDVKVPSDFSSTVIFDLKQSEQKAGAPKLVISKKSFSGIIILLLTVLALFFGIHYFKRRNLASGINDRPTVVIQEIKQENIPIGFEADLPHRQTDAIDIMVEPPEEEEAIEESFQKTSASDEEDSAASGTPEEDKISISKSQLLHWHFLYAEENEKQRLLNIFSSLGIVLDYKDYGLLLFTATGEEFEEVVEQILLISRKNPSLRDFTAGIHTFPDKEYRVSIYLEKKKSDNLHWHILFYLPYQKEKFLEIISKSGGSVVYKSRELIVLSIPKTGVEKLSARIRAMRVDFSEFGKVKFNEDKLMGSLVRVSIYFLN